MWRSIGLIGLGMAVVLGTAASVEAVIIPAHLRCEYHANPPAIDAAQPRLSWIVTGDAERGQAQTAYRVLVASSPLLLDMGQGDLWDSGRVASDQSAQIVYAGKPLGTRVRCYWKVRLWDQAGKAAPWSDTARWTMGLLQPGDWKAEWIGGSAANGAAQRSGLRPAIYLRKSFQLRGTPQRAMVYATAAGVYELQINGQRVGHDYFTPGWTEYGKRVYYQAYDVTILLRSGENVMGAALGDGWYGLRHGGRGRLALLAQLHVHYEDGSEEVVATDGTWRATEDGPIRLSDMFYGETYDARKELTGWSSTGYRDGDWSPAGMADLESCDGRGPRGRDGQAAAGGPRRSAGNRRLQRAVRRPGRRLRQAAAGELSAGRQTGAQGGGGTRDAADRRRRRATADRTCRLRRRYSALADRPRGAASPPRRPGPQHAGAAAGQIQPGETGRVAVRPRAKLQRLGAAEGLAGPRAPRSSSASPRCSTPTARSIPPTSAAPAPPTPTSCRGAGEEIWEPRFTFHGFRYVEVDRAAGPARRRHRYRRRAPLRHPARPAASSVPTRCSTSSTSNIVWTPAGELIWNPHRLPATRRADGLDRRRPGLSSARPPSTSTWRPSSPTG